jgi:hypothetical protein
MLFIDSKYASMLEHKLRNFKYKGNNVWNMSCPICGDSKKKKTKARGFIYESKGSLFFKCHNCACCMPLGAFIEHIDQNLYNEYRMETFQEHGLSRSAASPTTSTPKETELVDSVLDSIPCLATLPIDHPAVQFVLNRKIPARLLDRFYFAPKYRHFVHSANPSKYPVITEDYPRLIIPYFNAFGKCFAFQARAFGAEEPKYLTIKIDEDAERIYGLDRVNYGKRVYITEGPIDSMLIPNAIAASGSSFNSHIIEALKTNATLVYDNEPRARDLTKIIKKSIDKGFAVCFWPETIKEKDINDMIKAGMTSEEIVAVIDNNTYSGMEAQLRFTSWKKC